METIQGKKPFYLTQSEFSRCIAGYQNIQIDLGTGDGHFVRHSAMKNQQGFFIGVDACRENLRGNSRNCLPNTLYLIANAKTLPAELNELAAQITINFPWGNLLYGLLDNAPALFDSLARVSRPNAALTIRLNGGALAEAGWELDAGTWQVYESLRKNGFVAKNPLPMNAADLRACPTTWAKRLAFGRDPRGWLITAHRPGEHMPIKEVRINESIFA